MELWLVTTQGSTHGCGSAISAPRTPNGSRKISAFGEENFDGTPQYARNKRVQVAHTEWWYEKYDKGVGFYSMHPGWDDTPGVAKSLPRLSEKWLSGNLRLNDD